MKTLQRDAKILAVRRRVVSLCRRYGHQMKDRTDCYHASLVCVKCGLKADYWEGMRVPRKTDRCEGKETTK